MRTKYPPIEPYATGHLDAGDGHRVFWEASGNPDGIPALVVHGGPGSAPGPGIRRYFDPARYRIVVVDQRGCGRSEPHAADTLTALEHNSTDDLVADFERLRELLRVDRWVLFGGSWGCVLGLTYAERFPARVRGIVMMGLATGRAAEVELLTVGLGRLFPEAHARFLAHLPEADRANPAAGYARLLADPDPAVVRAAMHEWARWEDAQEPGAPGYLDEDERWQLAMTRLVTHYWSHDHFLDEGAVLRDAGRLAGIPGVLVQGRLDLGNLLGTPWELAAAWPDARLELVDAAHETRSEQMIDRLVGALDELADRFATEDREAG